jgi:hypothetical protein
MPESDVGGGGGEMPESRLKPPLLPEPLPELEAEPELEPELGPPPEPDPEFEPAPPGPKPLLGPELPHAQIAKTPSTIVPAPHRRAPATKFMTSAELQAACPEVLLHPRGLASPFAEVFVSGRRTEFDFCVRGATGNAHPARPLHRVASLRDWANRDSLSGVR